MPSFFGSQERRGDSKGSVKAGKTFTESGGAGQLDRLWGKSIDEKSKCLSYSVQADRAGRPPPRRCTLPIDLRRCNPYSV